MWNRLINNFYKNLTVKVLSTLALTIFASFFLLDETTLIDWRFRIRGPEPADSNLVLVTLDETFATNHNYPDLVPRNYLAALIDTLCQRGASVIAMDYAIRVSDREDNYYEKLRAAINTAGNVVLPSAVNPHKRYTELLSIPPREIRDVTLMTGYANLDEPAYQMTLCKDLDLPDFEPAFALAAVTAFKRTQLQLAGNDPSNHKHGLTKAADLPNYRTNGFWASILDTLALFDDLRLCYALSSNPINYSNEINTHASEDLLQSDSKRRISPEYIKDKLVLVGSVYTEKNGKDEFRTPFGLLQGVEVHANIVSSILKSDYLTEPKDIWKSILISLPFLAAALSVWFLPLARASFVAFGFLVIYLLTGLIVFSSHNLLLPLAGAIRAGFMGFFLVYVMTRFQVTYQKYREYLDFTILVQPHALKNHYRLHLLTASEQAADVSVEIQSSLTSEFLADLERLEKRRVQLQFVEHIGRQLFDMLFAGEMATAYRVALAQARTQRKGLRVQLRIEAPELRSLPWEYLYDPYNRVFLSANPEILLSRYVSCRVPSRKMTVDDLNMLVVISNPTDVAPLDTGKEKELIEDAMEYLSGEIDVPVSCRILEHAIPDQILEALNDRVQIFHFIGHSTYRDGKAIIVLENEAHRRVMMEEQQFAEFFKTRPEIRLVILNSCKGAKTSALQDISGLAYHIIDQGGPAVIGMQYSIADSSAIHFTRLFYKYLRKMHSLELAMALSRQGLLHKFKGIRPKDFGIPILFTRTGL